jgi:hypothetical protein
MNGAIDGSFNIKKACKKKSLQAISKLNINIKTNYQSIAFLLYFPIFFFFFSLLHYG